MQTLPIIKMTHGHINDTRKKIQLHSHFHLKYDISEHSDAIRMVVRVFALRIREFFVNFRNDMREFRPFRDRVG